jgi:signal transduction histidine kinase
VQTQSGELLGVVAVLRDITRERQAERAKSEFIATISHELRTPLTSIKGYADLVNAGVAGPLNEEQQAFVGKICTQSARLTRLINQVIQYSEMDRSGPVAARQPFDLGQVVRTAIESASKRIEADGLHITLNVEPGAPLAYGDPTCTRQIIDQLLDNAARFTPAPGQITISIRPVEIENGDQDRKGRYLSSLSPLSVSLSISDTGVGIAPQDIERVFERFYRADNPMQFTASGLGLGLTMARTLATAQGGQLWAASPAIERSADAGEEHPGATFTLRLPAHVS